MKHYDADERNMATSDLINELKNAQLEATLQVIITSSITIIANTNRISMLTELVWLNGK
jgi:hypothetical protein